MLANLQRTWSIEAVVLIATFVAALDALVDIDSGGFATASTPSRSSRPVPPTGTPDLGSAGPALDARARAAYRARVAVLEASGESGTELAALRAELSRGTGFGGRDRFGGSSGEKARVNLTQRIRDAVDRIAAADPGLRRHLDQQVHTGTTCVYHPFGLPPARGE